MQAARLDRVAHSPRAVCPVVGTESNLLGLITHLAGVERDDVLLDIGCGDGRLLVHAARQCHCRCVGVDVRPGCLQETRLAAEKAGVSHLVTAVDFDMMQDSFASLPHWPKISVIYAYLLPDCTLKLAPVLHRAVEEGKVVVLYCSTGSRVRRSNAPAAGNVIGDMRPAAQAALGRLRLYCLPGVLAHRVSKVSSKLEAQDSPPPRPLCPPATRLALQPPLIPRATVHHGPHSIANSLPSPFVLPALDASTSNSRLMAAMIARASAEHELAHQPLRLRCTISSRLQGLPLLPIVGALPAIAPTAPVVGV